MENLPILELKHAFSQLTGIQVDGHTRLNLKEQNREKTLSFAQRTVKNWSNRIILSTIASVIKHYNQ